MAEQQIDFAAVNLEDLHEKYDNVDPHIEQYFSAEEVKKMSDYEKQRYRNMKRNYLALNAIGIPYHLPDFMKRKMRERPPPAKWTSSESETEEWKPRGAAQPKQGDHGGARKKTPQQKPRATRRQRKAKQQAEAAATAKPAEDQAAAAKESAKTAVAAAAGLSSQVFEEGDLQDFDLLDQFPDMIPTNPLPPPPPPPPGMLDGPRFAGFTKEFSKPRIEALDRAMRHRRRLIDLLEEDNIKMKHVEIVDPTDTGEKQKYDKYGRKIKKAPETNHRYPKRNIGRLNYAKLEVPSDDEFLYCEDCRREYRGQCPVHGPLNFIPEISNTLDTSLIGTDAYAESTLLPFLCVKKSEVTEDAGYGIFASTKIPRNSVFGPYDGILTKDGLVARETGYSWMIYKDNKPNHYIDGSKKGYSNWMRWVNSACHEEEQNLLAFQLKKEIFYKVIRDIEPKEELLVWYGNDYALEMGLKIVIPTRPGGKAATGKDSAKGTTASADQLPASDLATPTGTGARPKQKSVPKKKPAKTGSSAKAASSETPLIGSTAPNLGQHQPSLLSVDLEKANQLDMPILGLGTDEDTSTDLTEIPDERIPCPHCKVVFLQSRMRFHKCSGVNGVDVFQCEGCYDLFSGQDFLMRHAHSKHGIPFPLEFIKRQIEAKKMRHNQQKATELRDQPGITSEVKGKITAVHSPHSYSGKVMKGDESGKSDIVVLKDTGYNAQLTKDKNYAVETKFEIQSGEVTGESLYNCRYCGKGFKNVCNTKTHERIHTGDKPFKCQYCDKRFTQKAHLVVHERTHTGQKPYKCQYCEKRFSSSGNVKTHELTHTGQKPYKCQYCEKRFATSYNLIRHERAHTGEKPYKCQFCDKRFTQSCEVKSHERTHTGDKPYKCPICDQQFAQRSYLTTHLKTHTTQAAQ